MNLVKLKELCNFEKGNTGLAKAEPGKYPLVTTGAERKTCTTYQFDTKAVCIPLVSSTGHGHASLKNVHYQEGKFALGTILVVLTSKDEDRLNIQFLHLYLSQLKDRVLVPLMSGAANVALSVRKIQNVEIPLPSIERQKEIVESFKSIVIEEGELKAELIHQQTLLKKLRQQILQEAIESKLTADWRKQNSDVEPASKLLERIAAEKAQLIKENKIKKQKPLPPISGEEKPFELPERWEWSRIGEITVTVTSGSRNWKSLYADHGASFVRSQDIKHDRLLYADRAYVNVKKGEEGTRTFVKQHDWLIIITGANVGKCAYLTEEPGEAYVSQHVALMRPTVNSIGKFGHIWLIAEFGGRGLLAKSIYGDKPGLNLPQLRNLLIPVPPVEEQKAIVQRVEKLFRLCDELEFQIAHNQTHAEQLMQAVLKEAFQSGQKIEHQRAKTKKPETTPIPDNVVPLKPTRADYYKRMLLAAEIVHQLHREPTLGHLKLQKLIYLCQKTEQMQLPTNFLQQAAGPYDPKMARSLDKQLKDKKWFSYRREETLKYIPLEEAGSHQADFDKYFAQQKEGIHTLINLFRKAKSDQMEIVATLYACWEKLLQEEATIYDELIFERFYQWSEEKAKYPSERLKTAIEWMCKQGIVPKGMI